MRISPRLRAIVLGKKRIVIPSSVFPCVPRAAYHPQHIHAPLRASHGMHVPSNPHAAALLPGCWVGAGQLCACSGANGSKRRHNACQLLFSHWCGGTRPHHAGFGCVWMPYSGQQWTILPLCAGWPPFSRGRQPMSALLAMGQG